MTANASRVSAFAQKPGGKGSGRIETEASVSRQMQWLLTAVCTVGLAGSSIEAKPRVRFGGFTVGAGYSYGTFPYYSPYYYDPWFYGFAPFFYPGYINGFAYQPNMGEVKLVTPAKTGEVFLNGGYAGDVSKLKTMWLDPGAYELEIRDGNHSLYQRRIYVLTGKTLKIRAPEK